MEFLNYKEVLDYEPKHGEVAKLLWEQNNRNVVLYCGEHILFNEYAKTVDLFMDKLNKLNHNIEVLMGNRITKEMMESAIKSYEYIKEEYDKCERNTFAHEMFLMYTDCIKTMMGNSGHYKMSIFRDYGELVECTESGD